MGPVKAGKAIRKLVTAIHGVDPEAEDTGTNPQAPPVQGSRTTFMII